jgi:hypothetical protein
VVHILHGPHWPSEHERPHKATRESLIRPVLLTSRSNMNE